MKMVAYKDTPRYMSVKEVADALRVHPMTVYGWLSDGKLGGFKFGKSWRILWDDVMEFGQKSTER